jgi:hypothetical protein
MPSNTLSVNSLSFVVPFFGYPSKARAHPPTNVVSVNLVLNYFSFFILRVSGVPLRGTGIKRLSRGEISDYVIREGWVESKKPRLCR